MMRSITGVVLTVVGIILLLHHLIVYGHIFDVSDWIGHDWLGLILSVIGIALVFYKREKST